MKDGPTVTQRGAGEPQSTLEHHGAEGHTPGECAPSSRFPGEGENGQSVLTEARGCLRGSASTLVGITQLCTTHMLSYLDWCAGSKRGPQDIQAPVLGPVCVIFYGRGTLQM